MITYAPFTRLRHETIEALEDCGAIWLPVGLFDDDDYWRLLQRLWTIGHSFVIVEHDIIVAPDTIAGFEACDNDWCACTYRCLNDEAYAGLGCVRFSAALIAAHPWLMDDIGTWTTPQHPVAGHYCALDTYIQVALRSVGEECCIHGTVGHLGSGVSPHDGAVCDRVTV